MSSEEENGTQMFVCFKNLHTGKKHNYPVPAHNIFVINKNTYTQFTPSNLKDFQAKTVYGYKESKWMVYILIIFLAETKKEAEERMKTGRLPDPKKLLDQPGRELFSKFVAAEETRKMKETSKEEKERQRRAKQESAKSVLARYSKSDSSQKRKCPPLESDRVKKIKSVSKDSGKIPEALDDEKDDQTDEEASKSMTEKENDNDFSLIGTGSDELSSAGKQKEKNKDCECCEQLKSQYDLMNRELEMLRIQHDQTKHKLDRVTTEYKTVQNVEGDQSAKLLDKINDVAVRVEKIENLLMSKLFAGIQQPRKDEIDTMSCGIELPEHQEKPEITEAQIYCENGIIVQKKDIKGVGDIKNLQSKVQALANLFWPGKVHEWALTKGTAPNIIEDTHIEAMTNLLNKMEWTSELHVNSTERIVRDKMRKVTSLARVKQRGVLQRAGAEIPNYLQDDKGRKKRDNKEEEQENSASGNKDGTSKGKAVEKTKKKSKVLPKAPSIPSGGNYDHNKGNGETNKSVSSQKTPPKAPKKLTQVMEVKKIAKGTIRKSNSYSKNISEHIQIPEKHGAHDKNGIKSDPESREGSKSSFEQALIDEKTDSSLDDKSDGNATMVIDGDGEDSDKDSVSRGGDEEAHRSRDSSVESDKVEAKETDGELDEIGE